CEVNFAWFPFAESPERHEWLLAQYAALLIHEATHGRLHALYFHYNAATRLRIERICTAEARRFVAQLRSEQHNLTYAVVAFDPRRWRRTWEQTPGERRRETWFQLKAVLKPRPRRRRYSRSNPWSL